MSPSAQEGQGFSYLFLITGPVHMPGGVTEVVINLARQLEQRSGYRPVIARAAWDDTPPPQPVVRGCEVVGVRLRDPFELPGGLRYILAAFASLPFDAWRLLRFLRARRVRVLNFHFPSLHVYTCFVLKWLRLFNGSIVLSFHGTDMKEALASTGWRRLAWLTVLNQADAVVTCSKDLAQKTLSLSPRAVVMAIPNGAEVATFNRPRRPLRPRRAILHVGKFEHNKAQDVLLQAFHLLRKSVPDASLVLAGTSGSGLASIQQLICDLELEAHVRIHVDVPHAEVPGFMDQADLFVLPSRNEAFGIVLLEAGAAYLPVVASNVGGIPELIEDGVTGLLVPPASPVELEVAIRRMLTVPEDADRMAQVWHDRVMSTWSWEHTCDEYLALICRLKPKP